MRRAERERVFKHYLICQKPFGEIAQRMHISDYRLQQLIRTASSEGWAELQRHKPLYELYRSDEFPESLVSDLANRSNIPVRDCNFVKVKERDDGTCTIRGLQTLPGD